MSKKTKKMLQLELGLIILVLIIFLIVKMELFKIIPQCLIKSTFGINCPSCGGTRCVANFILGNWKASFYYHPLFFITILYLLFSNALYIINSFRKREEIGTFLYPKTTFWILWTVVLLIFTIVRNVI